MYISALLLALRSMLQMDLPHLNVLTKIDNLSNYSPLAFNLDFYTEVQDLEYLLPALERDQNGESPLPDEAEDKRELESEPENSKFSALNRAIVELVQDFALVGFETLAVEDKKSMASLLKAIDRASGYAFGTKDGAANDSVWQVAMQNSGVTMDVRDVQERWIDRREEMDKMEREGWQEEGREWRGDGDDGREQQVPVLSDDEMEIDEMMGGDQHVPRDHGIKITRKPPPEVKGG
jgi:hypothetical protein